MYICAHRESHMTDLWVYTKRVYCSILFCFVLKSFENGMETWKFLYGLAQPGSGNTKQQAMKCNGMYGMHGQGLTMKIFLLRRK